MVEGPGCSRNRNKAQPAIGHAVTACEFASQSTQKTLLTGRRLIQVFSVGKELFLVFGPRTEIERLDDDPDDTKEIALRLHFGMNGCLYLRNKGAPSQVPHWRKESPSLLITFESGRVIETVSSTTCFLSAFVARSKLSRLAKLDVCSEDFDQNAVFEGLRTRPSVLISDALLDQNRFPGVGNIIKIEGLHKACVHPKRIVSSLSDNELRDTIHYCREYAMRWYKSGRAPSKMVYNKTRCGTCTEGQVRMIKLGNTLSRTTFWCDTCQQDRNRTMGNLHLNGGKRESEIIEQQRPEKQLKVQTNNTLAKETPVNQPPRTTVYSCPQHGPTTLLLKRVRKTDSCNRNRLFRSCKVRQCQHFAWADSHLPLCSCNKKSILRVSKTEQSGGRWFVCCAAGSRDKPPSQLNEKQCGLFSWAKPELLAPFGRLLTPLL